MNNNSTHIIQESMEIDPIDSDTAFLHEIEIMDSMDKEQTEGLLRHWAEVVWI